MGELQAEQESEAFEVWPENERALRLFLALATQWRVHESMVSGIIYASVEAVMRMQCVPVRDRAELLGALQVMESAAKRVLNDRKK